MSRASNVGLRSEVLAAFVDEMQKIAEEQERMHPLTAASLVAGGTLAGSASARLLARMLERRGAVPVIRSSLDYLVPALAAGAMTAGLARDFTVARGGK